MKYLVRNNFMETELYNKIFQRLDELGAIRKDLSFGFQVLIFKQPPILSDVLNALDMMYGIWANGKGNISYVEEITRGWDLSKPYLKDQSNELGEILYSLIR
jgi:hypothetical protein